MLPACGIRRGCRSARNERHPLPGGDGCFAARPEEGAARCPSSIHPAVPRRTRRCRRAPAASSKPQRARRRVAGGQAAQARQQRVGPGGGRRVPPQRQARARPVRHQHERDPEDRADRPRHVQRARQRHVVDAPAAPAPAPPRIPPPPSSARSRTTSRVPRGRSPAGWTRCRSTNTRPRRCARSCGTGSATRTRPDGTMASRMAPTVMPSPLPLANTGRSDAGRQAAGRRRGAGDRQGQPDHRAGAAAFRGRQQGRGRQHNRAVLPWVRVPVRIAVALAQSGRPGPSTATAATCAPVKPAGRAARCS